MHHGQCSRAPGQRERHRNRPSSEARCNTNNAAPRAPAAMRRTVVARNKETPLSPRLFHDVGVPRRSPLTATVECRGRSAPSTPEYRTTMRRRSRASSGRVSRRVQVASRRREDSRTSEGRGGGMGERYRAVPFDVCLRRRAPPAVYCRALNRARPRTADRTSDSATRWGESFQSSPPAAAVYGAAGRPPSDGYEFE